MFKFFAIMGACLLMAFATASSQLNAWGGHRGHHHHRPPVFFPPGGPFYGGPLVFPVPPVFPVPVPIVPAFPTGCYSTFRCALQQTSGCFITGGGWNIVAVANVITREWNSCGGFRDYPDSLVGLPSNNPDAAIYSCNNTVAASWCR